MSLWAALGFSTLLSLGSQDLLSRQRALDGLLGLVKMPLSKGKHCATARARSTDKTVGDVFSSYLASLGDRTVQNWIDAGCESATKGEETCSVVIRSDPSGESPMASGFTFRITLGKKPKFVPGSLVCTGT